MCGHQDTSDQPIARYTGQAGTAAAAVARRTSGSPKAKNETPPPKVNALRIARPMNNANCTPTGDGEPGAGGHRSGWRSRAATVMASVNNETFNMDFITSSL